MSLVRVSLKRLRPRCPDVLAPQTLDVRRWASSAKGGDDSDGIAESLRKGMDELKQMGPQPGTRRHSYAERPLETARRSKSDKSVKQMEKERQYFDAFMDIFSEEFESHSRSRLFYQGFAGDVVAVSLSPDLRSLKAYWALNGDDEPPGPEFRLLYEGLTLETMPAVEAKILKKIEQKLNANVNYLRSLLAIKVNSKKVPNLEFRHFSEQDSIIRAAFKNYSRDSYGRGGYGPAHVEYRERSEHGMQTKEQQLSENESEQELDMLPDTEPPDSGPKLRFSKRHAS